MFKSILENFIDLEPKEGENSIKTKPTRLSFGGKAEDIIYSDLVKHGVEVELLKQRKGWNPTLDLKFGDLFFIKKQKYVDVKLGRGISKRCLDHFQGDGFLFSVGVPPTGGNISEKSVLYVTLQTLKDVVAGNPEVHNNVIDFHRDAKKQTLGKNGKPVVFAKLPSGEVGYYFNFDLITKKISYSALINK